MDTKTYPFSIGDECVYLYVMISKSHSASNKDGYYPHYGNQLVLATWVMVINSNLHIPDIVGIVPP